MSRAGCVRHKKLSRKEETAYIIEAESVAPSLSPVNCRRTINLLSAYIDGELPGVEHRQVHNHLPQCCECEREYLSLLQMKRMLGSLRVQEPSIELPQVILHRVHLAEHEGEIHQNRGWHGVFSVLLRMHLVSLRPLVLGSGIACVAVLLTAHLAKPDEEADFFSGTALNASMVPASASQAFIQVSNYPQVPSYHQMETREMETKMPLHNWDDNYPPVLEISEQQSGAHFTPVSYSGSWIR